MKRRTQSRVSRWWMDLRASTAILFLSAGGAACGGGASSEAPQGDGSAGDVLVAEVSDAPTPDGSVAPTCADGRRALCSCGVALLCANGGWTPPTCVDACQTQPSPCGAEGCQAHLVKCEVIGLITPVGGVCSAPSFLVDAGQTGQCCENCVQSTGLSGAFPLGDAGVCPPQFQQDGNCCAPSPWVLPTPRADGGVQCGAIPCPLPGNACCLDSSGVAMCLPEQIMSPCPGPISVGCVRAADCPTGEICCMLVTGSFFGASCGDAGTCSTAGPDTAAQLCDTNSECTNGQRCVPQSCVVTALADGGSAAALHACGLVARSAAIDCQLSTADGMDGAAFDALDAGTSVDSSFD